MASRTDPRHLIRLRIKVTGTDGQGNRFAQTAFTHDVSARGARVTDVPSFLHPAAVINVEYRGRRSRFQVIWIGPANYEVGLLSLEPRPCIWGTPLPGPLIRCVASPPPADIGSPHNLASTRILSAYGTSGSEAAEGIARETQKRVGYFCKNPECCKTHVFHLVGDGIVVWAIWPQKFECPRNGKRYDYWKEEVRSAGYASLYKDIADAP